MYRIQFNMYIACVKYVPSSSYQICSVQPYVNIQFLLYHYLWWHRFVSFYISDGSYFLQIEKMFLNWILEENFSVLFVNLFLQNAQNHQWIKNEWIKQGEQGTFSVTYFLEIVRVWSRMVVSHYPLSARL